MNCAEVVPNQWIFWIPASGEGSHDSEPATHGRNTNQDQLSTGKNQSQWLSARMRGSRNRIFDLAKGSVLPMLLNLFVVAAGAFAAIVISNSSTKWKRYD